MPVKELTLRTASLTNMLDWLTQPQGPHLVDSSSTENPLTALAILIAPEALYDSDSPMVGLGLVYKAPYIQTTSWTEAYFDLKLASQAEASNRPTRTKVIFVQIHASSQVIPLPGVPTLFLDVKTPEDITDSKAPRPPQDFRGFQLFQVVMKSGDPPSTQVAIPRLQGKTECSWISKQEQVLPPELEEAPQITVPLSVANPHHWNIVNDPIFPNCLATFRVRHEASLASGTAASTGGASSRGGGSTPLQELPSVTWPQHPPTPPLEWHEVDKRVTEVMDQVHDFHLQLLQEIGFVREIDQALSKSLMVEFLRLKVIIGDDLSGALRTWQNDMEVATDKFLRDLDAATQTSTALPSKNAAVGVALRQFRAASQLRVALPLTQLDEAREEMETFIQSRLEELRSPQETKNLIGELSSRITDHRGRVRELLGSKPLRHPEVAPLIMVGLAADRPIESNFFPSLLEGLLGSLGMAAPGEGNPPVSSCEGAGRAWSTAVHGAISRTEQKEVEAPEAVGLPPNLDLRYKESFLEKQRHLIPPIFLDPLFIPKVAKAVFRVAKPLVVSKALPVARSREVSSTPPQPGGRGPEQQVLKLEEPVPSTSQSAPEIQEQISKASNTDSDGADEPPPEREPPRRTLKVRLPLKLLKCGHQATASGSKDGVTPSKVRMEPEAEEAEVGTPTGPSEAALQKARFELFQKDLPVVQEVRARILELQEGEVITQQVLDSSPTFHLRRAADESRAPTIIGEHWIDHLDAGGHIAKCKPHDFKFEDEWLPLYTRAGITRHVSGLSSLLKTQGDSPLVAVVPRDMLFQSDREYVIHKLHEEDCLSRVTIYYGENLRKQIAFCPYCGVMNENTATTYSHVRKHLGITFLCGGCYTKLYKAPQHLSQHMKTCPPCLMNRPEGSWRSVRKK